MKRLRLPRNLPLVCALVCAQFLFVPCSMARQFTDAEGRTIEADIVGASDTHVMLKRNGRTFKVSLEKLSPQDRLHIEEMREQGERRRKLAEARAAILRKSNKTPKSTDDDGGDSVDDGGNDFMIGDNAKTKPDAKGDDAGGEQKTPAKPKPEPVGKVGKEKFEGTGKDVLECYVYKPTTLKPGEKRPVMYVLGTGHSALPSFHKYVKGAEMNGFLLIMPIYPHGSDTPAADIDKLIIEKTMAKLPVDKNRVFLSGFSSTADRAYLFATELGKKAVVGILACDAGIGQSKVELDRGIAVYATCGAGSKRRYEMAYMFEKMLKGKEHRLRFFMGSNTWPEEDLITEGVTWLNLCNLAGAPRDAALVKERRAVVGALLKQAGEERKDDPVTAYKTMAVVRDTSKDAAELKMVTAACSELEKNEAVKAYVAGKQEADKFVSRYFANEDPRKRDMKKEDRAAKRAGERLAEEFDETEWGPLLGRMGDTVL